MIIPDVLEWLERTALAALIQESAYGFPLVVAVHLMALTFSVGALVWVDLRMLGIVLPDVPLTTLYRSLAPWFLIGFALMLASGASLFVAFATSAYANLYFRIKVITLLLAGVNALAFHLLIERRSATGAGTSQPPAAVRLAGLASLCLWVIVIACGRMMSYTMFSFG